MNTDELVNRTARDNLVTLGQWIDRADSAGDTAAAARLRAIGRRWVALLEGKPMPLETPDTALVVVLQGAARQLALLPAAEIEAHVRKCRESIDRAEGVGCFFDPTGYMAAVKDGSFESARLQLRVAEHLLAARKAIDELEAAGRVAAARSAAPAEAAP